MIEIIAYQMQYNGVKVNNNLELEILSDENVETYIKIYNECFYNMREALEVKPYNVYSNKEELLNKKNNIFVLYKYGTLIGSVACYQNEIDDLIVNKLYQGQGYGKQILTWAIKNIQIQNDRPITLHVAKWNENAVKLYEKVGFKYINSETIR